MGMMVILFGILMFLTSRYLCHVTTSSLILSFENTDLVSYLREEKNQVEKLNEKYKSEITERKTIEAKLKEVLKNLEETQDMLIRSERLAVVGRLASAIGHEVLNPVNIIHMRLQLLNQIKSLPEKMKDSIRICKDQIDRIVRIMRNIGQFSRSRDEELSIFTPTPLNEIINYALEMYGPELKEKNVITNVRFHDDLPLITMDRSKMEQVLFNIISNSIDAMADKKDKLLIIQTHPGSSRKYIQLVISDNGIGVEKVNLDRVMDPFFTTKDPNKGSGLGLFMSYLIVKNHGGSIKLENNDMGGTSIFIELPIDKETVKDNTYEGFRVWQT
jgi:signal transduction histidine kinase